MFTQPHARFKYPWQCVARVTNARAKSFDMHMGVAKRLAETVSKIGAHREKYSGRIIFKLLVQKQSNFC